MGNIKNKQEASKTDFSLTEQEFNFIVNMNAAKQNILQEHNRMISGFLYYVATTRLGYTADDELQFELDLANKDHIINIVKV